jgi:hypothetical protein
MHPSMHAWIMCACQVAPTPALRLSHLPLLLLLLLLCCCQPTHDNRFPGASYKSFSTQQEAQQHYASMTGRTLPGVTTAAAAAGPNSLAGSKRPHSAIDTSNPPPPAFTAAGTAAAVAAAGVSGQQQQQQQQPPGELQVTLFFDGGSRGNPGRGGYGYIIYSRATGQTVSSRQQQRVWGVGGVWVQALGKVCRCMQGVLLMSGAAAVRARACRPSTCTAVLNALAGGDCRLTCACLLPAAAAAVTTTTTNIPIPPAAHRVSAAAVWLHQQ